MDVGIWVDEGLEYKLKLLTGQVAPASPLYLLLIDTLGFTPSPTDTVSSLSQPAWSGYAPEPVTSWLPPTVDPVTHIASCQGANTVFTNTSGGSETVYGWALATGPSPSDTLLQCGAFGTPPVIIAGGVLVVTPTLTDKST